MSIPGADVKSQPIAMDYAKVKPMNHHSSTSEKSGVESCTDGGNDALSPSNGSRRKVSVKPRFSLLRRDRYAVL